MIAIALLIVAVLGIGAFFVLPATVAWVGWVIFGAAVLAMLILKATGVIKT